MKMENVVISGRPEKYFCQQKVNKKRTCLKIHSCDFCCNAVEVSHLKMSLNGFNSLQKTFDIKIMTPPPPPAPVLETLVGYCMK